MTFPARLSELIAKATKGPWTAGHPISKDHYGVCAYDYTYAIPQDINDAQLIAYLVNHAEAIRDLVVAADAVIARWDTPTWKDAEPTARTINAMREALAKLEEA